MKKEIFRAEGVCKSFEGKAALKDFRFSIYESEMVALVGVHSCGKTTFARIASGALAADKGQFYLFEKEVDTGADQSAREAGIHYIGQVSKLITELSIADNITLTRTKRTPLGKVDHRSNGKAAEKVCRILGISLPVDEKVKKLTSLNKVLIEFAKALYHNCKVLFVDEVISGFSSQDQRVLSDVVRHLRDYGVGVVLIESVNWSVQNADRIVLLRNGENAGNIYREDYGEEKIRNMLLGTVSAERQENTQEERKVLLEVCDLKIKGTPNYLNFHLYESEILGFIDQGNEPPFHILYALCGEQPIDAGTVMLSGNKCAVNSLNAAWKSKIAYIGGHHYDAMIFHNRSVADNFILPGLFRQREIISSSRKNFMKFLQKEYGEKIGIRENQWKMDAGYLTAEQKIKLILYRALGAGAAVILIEYFFSEIDDIAEPYILEFIREVKSLGKSIIYITPNQYSAFKICDRVYVMKDNEIVSERK